MTSTHEHVIMYWHSCLGVKPFGAIALAIVLVLPGSETSAKPARGHRHATAATSVASSRPISGGGRAISDDDSLYRAHGYGIGGVPFSLGGGTDQALSGACAQVANRNHACGPSGGYGIYGNGLGYGPNAH